MNSFEYKISAKNRIEYVDEKVLLYLYQPIVGSSAITLYKIMIHEMDLIKMFKSNVYLKLDRLIKLLSFKDNEEFFENVKKLEAMNLIETKRNFKTNKIIFNLLSPVDECEFFDNQLYSSYLCKKMGNDNFEINQFIFRNDNLTEPDDFLNTTENFADIFSDALIGDVIAEQKNIKPSKFNKIFNKQYEDLLILATKYNLENVINEGVVKKVIKSAMDVYTLDNDDYIKIIQELQLNQNNKFDKNKFNDLCVQYQNNYKIESDNKSYSEIKRTKLAKKMVELSTEDSENYAKLLLKMHSLSEDITNMIANLRNNFLLDDSLINAIMEFSYYKNDGKVVPNYLYKIATTINDKNITTLEDVMTHLKGAYNGKKRQTKVFANIEPLEYDKTNVNYKSNPILSDEELLNWDGE
ncbi:DnaD domain protein [Spiroplasma endosymbiont of Crioceris asparagi]|uniref:DnaD domain protein n=1 Tax=Spiroplasma endosymbiont of Crioceris asparagi TaxID=3066286 RepID=UPI0030CB32A7